MKKPQWIVLVGSFLLFAVLYWGFETTTSKPKTEEGFSKSEDASKLGTSPTPNAKAQLNETQAAELTMLESSLELQHSDATKIGVLQKLSGWWYRNGNISKAGDYANKVAEIDKKDDSWSVAGATYHQGLLKATSDTDRKYCTAQAIKAFEVAQSLKPEEVEHQVNLALIYADAPPEDNPMKAVLMLRDLEQKHPNAPTVYNALGRLALRTNQTEKALQRLEKALTLDPNNKNTICLLAQAYEAAGQMEKAKTFAKKCR